MPPKLIISLISNVQTTKTLTQFNINVLRYEGIWFTIGLPVKTRTLNSGIWPSTFTITMSSIRLCDKSKTDNVLHWIKLAMLSSVRRQLLVMVSVLSFGSISEPRFSMVVMKLCDRFIESKWTQCSRFSIFCNTHT